MLAMLMMIRGGIPSSMLMTGADTLLLRTSKSSNASISIMLSSSKANVSSKKLSKDSCVLRY